MKVPEERLSKMHEPKYRPTKIKCGVCGGEIYQHEDIYLINRDFPVHEDLDCLTRALDDFYERMSMENFLGI